MTYEHEYETEAGTACERIAKALGVELNKRNPLASSLHGLATVLESYLQTIGFDAPRPGMLLRWPQRVAMAEGEARLQARLLPSCTCGKDRECPIDLARGPKRYGCPCGDDACDCPRAAHYEETTARAGRKGA